MRRVRKTFGGGFFIVLALAAILAAGCSGSSAGKPGGSGGNGGESAMGGGGGSSVNPDGGNAGNGGQSATDGGGGSSVNPDGGNAGNGGSSVNPDGGNAGTSGNSGGGAGMTGGDGGTAGGSGTGRSTGTFVAPTGPLLLDIAAATNPVTPTGRMFYEVTVSNVSAQPVAGVSLSLLLPASLQFNGAADANPDSPCFNNNCAANSRANWTIGTLDVGASQTITINAQVIAVAVADGDSISASFTLMATGISPLTVSKTVQVFTQPQAQLTFGTTTNPVTAGGALTYDIDVGQIGTVSLTGATLRAFLPAGLLVNEISAGGTQSVTTPGEIDWTIGNVGVGATLHRSIRVTIDGAATAGSIFPARAVLAYAGTDPNESAEFSVAVVGAPPPLTVSWDTTGAPVAPGGRLLHTLTIGNVSTRPVSGVALVLRLPSNMQFNGATDGIPDASCFNNACNANTEAVWNVGTIAAGASTTIAFNGLVIAAAAPDGTLVSTHLTLAATGMEAFNLVKTAPVFGESQAELAFGTATNPVTPDGSFIYDLDIGHAGATPLTGTQVSVFLPANLAVTAISNGGTQTIPGQIDWNVGALAVGASVHRSLQVKVAAGVAAGEFLHAHAVLTHDGGLEVDGSADYSVAVVAAPQPLLVDVGAAASPGLPGGRLLYTMTISNVSLQPIDGVSLTLSVPAGLQFNGANDAEPNAGCFNNACTANVEAPWTLGTIAAGASVSVAVNSIVPTGGLRDGNLVSARLTVAATGLDPTIVAKTVAIYAEPRAQLAFGTASNPIVPGDTFTYDLEVGQLGATPLTGTTLRAFLPPGLTVVSASDGGTEGAMGEVDWNLATVAVGAALHRTVQVMAGAARVAGDQLAAHATLTYDGGLEVDAESDQTVSVVGAAQELTVTLTATPNPVRAATRLLYTLNITNVTARPVDGIGMMFRVPTNLSFNGAADANPTGGCFNNACNPGVEAIWSVGTLGPGLTQSIAVNALVAATVLGGTLLPATFKVTATGLDAPLIVETTVPVQ